MKGELERRCSDGFWRFATAARDAIVPELTGLVGSALLGATWAGAAWIAARIGRLVDASLAGVAGVETTGHGRAWRAQSWIFERVTLTALRAPPHTDEMILPAATRQLTAPEAVAAIGH